MINVIFATEERFLRPKISTNLARFGDSGDGGYVLSKDIISNSDILLSFGLGTNFSFEIAAKDFNPELEVIVWDHTVLPPRIIWVIERTLRGLWNLETKTGKFAFSFYKQYKNFFNRDNLHISKKIAVDPGSKSIENIEELLELYIKSRILLKIDIEGDEYKILPSILKYTNSVTGIIVEFHEIGDRRSECYELISELQETYEIEHIHVNNYGGLDQQNLPNVMEVSFVKKDLIAFFGYRESLPIELDSPNTLRFSDFHVIWEKDDVRH